MNFSVKSVLKIRHNYLIPFLFIFCARCIYKSSYTPPLHTQTYKQEEVIVKVCENLTE